MHLSVNLLRSPALCPAAPRAAQITHFKIPSLRGAAPRATVRVVALAKAKSKKAKCVLDFVPALVETHSRLQWRPCNACIPTTC